MSRKDDRATTDRREFLRFAGLAPVAGATALVTGKSEAEAAEPVSETRAGYRETEHVKTFYDSARF